MKQVVYCGLFVLSLLLVSCSKLIYNPRNAPYSLEPSYSTTTAIALRTGPRTAVIQVESAAIPRANASLAGINSFPTPNLVPYYDYKVVRFKSIRAMYTGSFSPPDYSKSIYTTTKMPYMPGTVMFTAEGLSIDEAEIPNIEWQLYVRAQVEAGVSLAELLPNQAALPVSDYFASAFYSYYPVVGISYEQAKQFCQWRTKVVNDRLAHTKELADVVCEYRLPTEAEWEDAAAERSKLPYGTTCLKLPVRVVEGAAAYLQKRANIEVPVAQIKADIVAYNAQHPVRSWINYAQPEPYFLCLATPVYVYQLPVNYFGLYQMLGNVAEMVQESGITKGGSYRDSLAACQIKARGQYSGPSATVGFRAVCTVRRVK